MQVIEKTKTYIIGDVHGCYYTLMSLIEKLEKNSTIIFVGDLIDKGNFSKKVVQYVIDNNHDCILGNHENLMIKYIKDSFLDKNCSNWSSKKYFGGYKTIEDYKKDKATLQKHLTWMKSLPRYIMIEKYFITHAFALPYYKRRDTKEVQSGLMSNRPSDKKQWGWDWEEGFEDYDITNIYGHEVVEQIDINKNFIGIDTGCVYGKKLSAIELNTKEVISVDVNIKDISNG